MKTGKRMILLLAAGLMSMSLAACKTDDAIRQTDDPVTDPPKVTGDAQTTVPDATSASTKRSNRIRCSRLHRLKLSPRCMNRVMRITRRRPRRQTGRMSACQTGALV